VSFLYFRGPNLNESNSTMNTPHSFPHRTPIVPTQDAPLAPVMPGDDANVVRPHNDAANGRAGSAGEFVSPQAGHPQAAIIEPVSLHKVAATPAPWRAPNRRHMRYDPGSHPELDARSREDNRAYVVLACATMLLLGVVLVGSAYIHSLRPKPVTLDPMPVVNGSGWIGRVCFTDTTKNNSETYCNDVTH
jgi:hypothetical protein